MSKLQPGEIPTRKGPSKLRHEPLPTVIGNVSGQLHRNTEQEKDEDNSAVEAADKGEELVETGIREVRHSGKTRERRGQAKADPDASQSNPISRFHQKQQIKKRYAKAKASGQEVAATDVRTFIEKVAEKTKDTVYYVTHNIKGIAIVLALFMLLSMLSNIVSSCSLMVQGIGSSLAGSTYPSSDADMLAAEAAYCAMEAALKRDLDNYELNHDYDEYEFELDEIKHDPYVLISTLTALHGGEWTLAEVQGTLQMLFDRQYTLTETVTTSSQPDPEHPDAAPMEHKSVKVKLKNNDLSHLQYEIMTDEQLARYSVYMSTLGNRPDLFPDSAYIGRYGEGSYIKYDIPPAALEDEKFAAMITEAEKYLGYPYVWGGSSPSTSFDCSGFVCWVINHSGWNAGRTTAQGLFNYCTPVRASDVRPGDLVFFIGTYDTPDVSHVGIYVGNNMMIHCGDPISYSNLNSSYWQSHFYSFGRLP